MTTIEELEKAVETLPETQYGEFRRWFLDRDWKIWDFQISNDSQTGKLDFLIAEAHDAKRANKLKAI